MARTAPTGLYSWIRSNDGRSLGLFLGFLIAVQLLAAPTLFLPLVIFDIGHAPIFAWGGYLLRYVPLVAIGSVIWFMWKYWWHIESVKKAVGFHFIDNQDEPYLCAVIEPLITMWGLPVPFVGVIESDARNAFACGIGRKKAVVVVTRGLITDLTREELECVLAHELSHIKNGDIRLMAAANIFMTALTDMQRTNPMRMTPVHVVLAIAIPAMLPITLLGNLIGWLALRAGQMSRLLIASKREFIADAEAVGLTKNPGAMASALVKVEHAHVVAGARSADDAMMIAGETEGENATHPTVAQRIAALARTTGSMVFISPHSPSAAQFRDNPSLSQAQAAALLRRLPPDRLVERISAKSRTNWLGLDTKGAVMAVIALGGLIGLHWEDFDTPRVMVAKFDARPIGLVLSSTMACRMNVETLMACEPQKRDRIYAQYGGQKNTLAGYLAQESRRRQQEGYTRPDLTVDSLVRGDTVMRAYRGQSGRMVGIKAEMEGRSDGLFSNGQIASNVVPAALVIAELEQVGCFQAKMFYYEPEGHFALEGDRALGYGVSRWEGNVRAAAISHGSPGGKDHDDWLRDYVEQRETLLTYSYSNWGLAGLARIREAYRQPEHAPVLAALAARMADPAFAQSFAAVERAKVTALLKQPEAFLPCPVLKHLPPQTSSS